jgi:demethylmenaquinone methyltransferase/2-methoxy-6-polyprenyl-1,4-benzoquinol methylase
MPGEYLFAKFYDPLVDPYIRKIRYKVLKMAKKYNPENILDVCCGTGHQLKLLKKHGFDVMGLDLSVQMLNISSKGKHAPQCIQADATAMPFENNSFNMVMTTLALHENTPEIAEKILGEMFRVTKPGGWIVIIDYEISLQTRIDARYISRTVEWIVGGDHYRNFKKYLKIDGLNYLLSNYPLSVIEEDYFAGHSIVMKVLRK